MIKTPIQQPDLTDEQEKVVRKILSQRVLHETSSMSEVIGDAMKKALKKLQNGEESDWAVTALEFHNQRPFVRFSQTVYLDPAIKAEITEECRKAGLTMADFIRWSIWRIYIQED